MGVTPANSYSIHAPATLNTQDPTPGLWSQSFCCSVTKSRLTLCTPWTAAHKPSLSSTISQDLLMFISIDWMMPSNNLILC